MAVKIQNAVLLLKNKFLFVFVSFACARYLRIHGIENELHTLVVENHTNFDLLKGLHLIFDTKFKM